MAKPRKTKRRPLSAPPVAIAEPAPEQAVDDVRGLEIAVDDTPPALVVQNTTGANPGVTRMLCPPIVFDARGPIVSDADILAELRRPAPPTVKPMSWTEAIDASAPAASEPPPVAPAPRAATARRKAPAEPGDQPDWDAIRAEAEELAPGPYGHLLWQEEHLAAGGFPRLSPWWLWTAEGFFASMKRWLLALAGRGAGKSTILTRLATTLALLTSRRIPPGQTWIWPFVSVLPVDAKRRLVEIQAVLLHAYGLEQKITSPDSTPTLAMSDALGNSIAWVSSASTIGNVSGPSSLGATMDEEEKILYERAGEILGSLGQTFRARAHIRGFRVSSAMSVEGTLYRSVSRGDTITNYVARIGPFLDAAVAGFLEVACWEEQRGNDEAARVIRVHVATLTSESTGIPTWLGNPTFGNPSETPWAPERAAVATRIEAEAVEPDNLGGVSREAYWLRECGSVPTGAGIFEDSDGEYAVVGESSRYSEETAYERGYDGA